MPPVAFAREPLTRALFDEALPLLFAHWREIAHYQDVELTPDVVRYMELEAAGILRCYTARADGLLVGYALFSVTQSLHYAQQRQAQQDVIYVQPSHRGLCGYRFLAFCTDQLFAEPVDVVYHHVKAAHNFGKVLERQGYEVIDVLYGKRNPVTAPVDPESAMRAHAEASS